MILEHGDMRGFVTPCGWNSVRNVTAGVPMVTWTFFRDKFYYEEVVTSVLKIRVGFDPWELGVEGVGVGREETAKAVKRVMVGHEAEEMRN